MQISAGTWSTYEHKGTGLLVGAWCRYPIRPGFVGFKEICSLSPPSQKKKSVRGRQMSRVYPVVKMCVLVAITVTWNVVRGSICIHIKSNLGSRTPRIMNSSVYEKNFPNTKRLEWRTVSRVTNTQAVKKRKRIPFQTITFHFLTTFHLRRQLSSIQVR